MNNTTHTLATRRSSIAQRFLTFRLAALAASAVASHSEASPVPRAPVMPRVWVAKRSPAIAPDPLDAPLSDAEIAALPAVPEFAPVASRDLLAEVDAEIAGESAFLAAVNATPLRLNA